MGLPLYSLWFGLLQPCPQQVGKLYSLWFPWLALLKIGRVAHMVLDTLLRAHTKRTLRQLGPPMLSSACSFVVDRGGAPKIEHDDLVQ